MSQFIPKILTATFLAAILALALGGTDVRAQALVINGETIADATLYAAAKKEGTFTVYGTVPPDTFNHFKAAFEKDTGIKMEFLRLPSADNYQRVQAEHAAGKLGADYVDLSDQTLIKQLVDRGILGRPHKVPAFERIAATLKDPEGRWYTLNRQAQVPGYNSAIVKGNEVPKSWNDLLNPKWKGKIGASSIAVGGSNFVTYAFLKEKVAPDYWAKLATQDVKLYPSFAPMVSDLARGEVHIALNSIVAFLDQRRQGAPVQPIIPSEGVAGFPLAGGITSTAKSPNAAAVFINWSLSKHGGTVIASQGLYATHPDAPPPTAEGVVFPPAAQVWSPDVDNWIKVRSAYIEEWQKLFKVQ